MDRSGVDVSVGGVEQGQGRCKCRRWTGVGVDVSVGGVE